MLNDRPGPNEARRSERSRSAILAATQELIATVGYGNMSIESIATRAGVGKQTIYRWWPSKAAVVLEMWVPEVHPHIGFPDTGDLAADLKTQLKVAIDLSADPDFGPAFRALIAEGQHDQDLAGQLVERIFGPRIEACKGRLRAAQEAGQLATDVDLDLAVDLLYGGLYHRYVLRVAPLTPAYADAVVDTVLRGLDPIGVSPGQ
jgi:AcrR family transcriptional regulator